MILRISNGMSCLNSVWDISAEPILWTHNSAKAGFEHQPLLFWVGSPLSPQHLPEPRNEQLPVSHHEIFIFPALGTEFIELRVAPPTVGGTALAASLILGVTQRCHHSGPECHKQRTQQPKCNTEQKYPLRVRPGEVSYLLSPNSSRWSCPVKRVPACSFLPALKVTSRAGGWWVDFFDFSVIFFRLLSGLVGRCHRAIDPAPAWVAERNKAWRAGEWLGRTGNKRGEKGVLCEQGWFWLLLGKKKVLSSPASLLGSALDELAVTC